VSVSLCGSEKDRFTLVQGRDDIASRFGRDAALRSCEGCHPVSMPDTQNSGLAAEVETYRPGARI
jgi:hypothetical protein